MSSVSVFQYHYVLFCKIQLSGVIDPHQMALRKRLIFVCQNTRCLCVCVCSRDCHSHACITVKYIEYPKHLHYSILMIARQFHLDFVCVSTQYFHLFSLFYQKTHLPQLQGSIIYFNVFFSSFSINL